MTVPARNTPSLFEDPRNAVRAVDMPANAPFRMRFHPDLWDLVPIEPVVGKGKVEHVLVPQLGHDILAAGVNGVHAENPDAGLVGEDCYTGLFTKQMAKGWHYITITAHVPAEFLPPGVEAGPLYRRTPVSQAKGGGVYHHECFEVITANRMMGGAKRTSYRQGYWRWLDAMAQAGAFGVPSEYAVEHIQSQIVNRREEIKASRTMSPDIRAERLAHIEAQVKALAVAAAKRSKVVADA